MAGTKNLLVLLCLCLPGVCLGQDPGAETTPKPAAADEIKIRDLIRQLGSDKYPERREAYDALKIAGRPALGPLKDALGETDAEISSRAADLLVEMRGRGFMGVQLQEQQNGQPVQQWVGGDDEEEAPPEAAPKQAKAPEWSPPPDVVAVQIVPDLPAEAAGIKDGDKFLSVNGHPIHGLMDLLREVILAGPGETAMIVVEREGKKLAIGVDLTCNPQDHPPIDLTADMKKPAKKIKPENELDDGEVFIEIDE